MNEKIYIDLIASQVKTIRLSSELVLPANHPALVTLDETLVILNSIKDEEASMEKLFDIDAVAIDAQAEIAPIPEGLAYPEHYAEFLAEPHVEVIPEGFTRESYVEFLNNNFEGDVAEEMIENGVQTYGYVDNGTGVFVEVGNFNDNAEKSADIVREIEEDQDREIDTENLIIVRYSRLNGEVLTKDDIKRIIEHPISEALKKLGDIYLLDINETESFSTKEAIFAIDDANNSMLKTLALNIAAYRGVQIFPGLGKIKAEGRVNFL